MLPARFADIPIRGVIGHRGMAAKAPENTLASFQAAVDLGVHGLEFDVRLTGDGQVVVFHDADLRRTTGVGGLVASTSWATMRTLDPGATFTLDGGRTFPFRDRGHRVSRLVEVLEALPDTAMIVEIKTPDAAAETRRVILEAHATDRCVVGAFRHETLRVFEGSGIARSASTREVLRLYGPAVLGARYTRMPYDVLSVPPRHRGIPVPLGALARAAAPAHVPVFAWTINTAAEAQACWSHGVRAVLSDDPATILAAR